MVVVKESTSTAFRTYRRRKERLHSEGHFPNDKRSSVNAAGLVVNKRIKQSQSIDLCSSSEQNGLSKLDGSLFLQSSVGCVYEQWRNSVLGNISRSLDVNAGGIQSCIQNVLASNPFEFAEMSKLRGASEQTAQIQELFASLNFHGNNTKCQSQLQREPKISFRSQNAGMEHVGATSDGSRSNPNEEENAMTLQCRRVFHDLIVSEKFSLLCKLLSENFQGIKVDSFAEFNVIDSRMREGAYGKSPLLFYTDIQAVWRKFQKIATDMVSLAKGLSDMSTTYYNAQVGALVNGICDEEKHELTKPEQAEASGLDKESTCRHCGSKADGKDCLICDSCEEMYHISCIEPVVEEIPPRCWYCANCTESGIEPSQENCVECERLKDPITQIQAHAGEEDITEPMTKDMLRDLEDKSTCMETGDVIPSSSESGVMGVCKICRIKEGDGQRLPSRICGHSQCPHKYYHVRCLTVKELKTYGHCWYCPSCLCRACLTDKDDNEIVLCDGCDHAYHIYCMDPPRTSIPKGKWFCRECDAGIRAVRKARRLYLNFEKRSKNGKLGVLKRTVGSVDMLLSAAEKLKSEEKLAAVKSKI